ncbi:MAG: LysM peptidoglycan-binding domain-containing protein, partial [Spirochaetales bacterium]|nr:LysM peptidoglycan-binding domain-containing protein [Spirochaetales bacterium]
AGEPAAAEQPAEPVPAGSEQGEAAAQAESAAEQAESAAADAGAGVWYQIKWGDTLWDIAATYYRNPWLYPKIARENRITNPDLIFAGTRIFIPEN